MAARELVQVGQKLLPRHKKYVLVYRKIMLIGLEPIATAIEIARKDNVSAIRQDNFSYFRS